MKEESSQKNKLGIYAQKDISAVYSDLGTSPDGLSDSEVAAKRRNFGKNNNTEVRESSVLHRVRRAFINPFHLILLLLAALSLISDIFTADEVRHNEITALIIFVMLLISGIVRFIQETQAKRALDRIVSVVSHVTHVRRSGRLAEIPDEEIVVGDTVVLSPGERIPADLRLSRAADLRVSQSALTGESAIIKKTARSVNETDKSISIQLDNCVFKGSVVTSGTGEGVAIAVGKDTMYGSYDTNPFKRDAGFERGTNSIAKVMIRFIAILVPIVFLVSVITKGDWITSFLFALSVTVGLVPEMLPMVVSACLVKGSIAMGKKKTIVKDINAMQGFGSMDVLCVDKTGTITGDKILLEYYLDVIGNESQKTLDLCYLNSAYHSDDNNQLDQAVLMCSRMPGKEQHFSNLLESHRKLAEIPFDYQRKYVSVLLAGEEENILAVKGSLAEVVSRCSFIEHQGKKIPLKEDGLSSVYAVVDEMLEDGMKVIAVAGKAVGQQEQLELEDECDLVLYGYIAFFDAPKKSAADAIAKLERLNVKTKVLTGDQKKVAVSVCRRIGVDTKAVLTGWEFEQLSEDEQIFAAENTDIFTELSPKQKKRIVRTLQENGHTVGFLGDGMNDLPAILQSDVGISVDTAVDVVNEAADIIVLKKDLGVLEAGILEGRKAFANMAKYTKITASSNLGNILSIVIASAFLPFLPMTAIQLLILNLLYDILCIALPWDNVDEEVYRRPQDWSEKGVVRFMLFFGAISTMFDIIAYLFLYYILGPAVCGGLFSQITDTAVQANYIALFQTGWFLVSIWTQVLILHLLRTQKVPFMQSKPSPVVLLTTLLGVLFFTGLMFTPYVGWLGITALPPTYFIFLFLVVIGYMILTTILKRLYIKKYYELT